MDKLQQIATTVLLSAGLGLGGLLIGTVSSQSRIEKLENKVEILRSEKNISQSENYQLHLDLIKRGNPHGWELYGDALGSWGYRKPDESAILGTVGEGYVYLTER